MAQSRFERFGRADMLRVGYTFKKVSTCKECSEAIEWWLTPKNKKSVPYNPAANENMPAVCHWQTCSKRNAHQQPTPDRQRAVTSLLRNSNARMVIALYDDGWYADVQAGIEPEDTRHELITAANALRRQMEAR